MTQTQDTPGLDRRSLFKAAGAAGLGIAFAGSIDALTGIRSAAAATTRKAAGYGALVADRAGRLALPRGFSYTVVAEAGVTLLESGEPTPSDADGTAAFSTPAGITLVNNHEIGGSEPFGVPTLPGLTYDPGARGGTTNIDVDEQGARIREYVSVAGTHNNCAGGLTPWGTWLTCEETEARAGGALQQDHGWCFEVSPIGSENAGNSPVPLKFLGRFAHEAVAVDPATSVIYETEDANNPHGLFYRWVPPSGFTGRKFELMGLPDDAGQLQAMRCSNGDRYVDDLSRATVPGTTYAVTWVDVPDRLATTTSVRRQFNHTLANGTRITVAPGLDVTASRKLEGAWWGDGGAYFVASYGRASDGSVNPHEGQVWFFDPASQTVELKTIFAPPADEDTHPDGPDNIVVSPYGGVILAEDGNGKQHLVSVTEQGEDYFLARNDLNGSEFAGPCFSPDNKILFANVQSPGLVYAIRGPWKSQRGS